jgi:flagellar basal body L-ring protein FlgH
VDVVQDCHAVEVEVSSTGTTVFEVTTVEVFLPIGQLVISGAQEVMVNT